MEAAQIAKPADPVAQVEDNRINCNLNIECHRVWQKTASYSAVLQRGFLFDVKTEKTYVHRRNGGDFPASISDVLAQRYFYSRLSSDGSKTLDDMITEYENRLGGLLIKLRAVQIDDKADADAAAEAIAHLTPRSANMRRIFGSGMEQLMTATAEAFADEDTVVTMLGLAEPVPNPTWNEHVAHMLENESHLKTLLGLLPIPKSVLDRAIFMTAKEHFVGSFDAKTLGIAEAFAAILVPTFLGS